METVTTIVKTECLMNELYAGGPVNKIVPNPNSFNESECIGCSFHRMCRKITEIDMEIEYVR